MFFSIAGSIERGIHAVTRCLSWISMVVLLLMMLLTAADVILRYFFNRPITGSVDIIELMIPVLGFFALAYTQKNKAHVNVSLVVKRFDSRTQEIIQAIICLVTAVLLTIVAWQIGNLAWGYFFSISAPRSLGLGIIQSPFYMVASLGILMMALETLVDFFHSAFRAVAKEIRDGATQKEGKISSIL